jgi:hypothetical protein
MKPDAFRLLAGEDKLGAYQFGTMSGDHRFCMTCGVRVYGEANVEQLGGEVVSVQVATLDAEPEELAAAPVSYGNGRDNLWWEQPSAAEMRYL